MNTNTKVYGLKASTVDLYSNMVKCGFSWSTAMEHLKELYEHNKKFAKSIDNLKN